MSIKITTTEAEGDQLQLLFEFTDYEVPEQIEIDYTTALPNSKFAGGLQTNQINGIYLEPITIKVLFKGSMVMNDGTLINAKERFDQLARLQGRPIKLFIENFKMICIIKSIKILFKNMQHIEADIMFQPHDFQKPIKPNLTVSIAENSIALTETTLPKNIPIDKELLAFIEELINKIISVNSKASTGVESDRLKNLGAGMDRVNIGAASTQKITEFEYTGQGSIPLNEQANRIVDDKKAKELGFKKNEVDKFYRDILKPSRRNVESVGQSTNRPSY